MKRLTDSAARIGLSLILTIAATAASAESFVIFGDSLSDTGNRHAASGMLSVPPYDTLDEMVIPSYPYAQGGIHYSNGRTWIERVAEALDAGGNARPASARAGNAANYAWGGSRAYDDTPFPDLIEQVTTYLADVNMAPDPEALHVIFMGGNDVVAALGVLQANPDDLPGAVGRMGVAAGSAAYAVNLLHQQGARRFLILNAPNVGLVPALGGGVSAQLATCFALLYNTGACPAFGGINIPVSLDGVVADLSSRPGTEVTFVDVFTLISWIHEAPGMFGLSDVRSSCVTPNVEPYACDDPDGNLFWDGIHPTRAVHAIFANQVLTALGH